MPYVIGHRSQATHLYRETSEELTGCAACGMAYGTQTHTHSHPRTYRFVEDEVRKEDVGYELHAAQGRKKRLRSEGCDGMRNIIRHQHAQNHTPSTLPRAARKDIRGDDGTRMGVAQH